MAITMASLRTAAIVATLIITATHHSTSAKPPSPPTQPGIAPVSARAITECFRALVNTSDCLSYVKSESNLTKPEKGCCPEIAGLVESNPICLCELLSHPGASGFAIDIKKALNLPSVCGVSSSSAPNVTSCSGEIPAEGSARNPSSEESTLSYLESQDDEDEASSIIKDSTLNFILLGFSTFIIFTLS
ncbi:non-specific lipid transfer protein GPI-anchored 11-like isoform X2 [Prosopis cineraria]|uniref:non-specific lipid transfer protein GPI-anchored 11-like isoform X2 n=1 Tax=Prosopis cineraria TaxID=364024 RepID=UPI002410AF9D|nr:non-specific lipid transfer protein GPI-anchored 11-like isoform X2 [Prosopis cineraria]